MDKISTSDSRPAGHGLKPEQARRQGLGGSLIALGSSAGGVNRGARLLAARPPTKPQS